jgi:hypothetical protein
MSGRILGGDTDIRKIETWHTDPDGGVVIASEQDVTEIIEANKQDIKTNTGFKGDMKHVARIPLVIYEDLKRRGIADDPAKLKAWLNDRDNVLFRTHPGRV